MSKRQTTRANLCSTLAIATALIVGASPAAGQALLGTVTSSSGVGQITTGTGTTSVAVTSPQAIINWSANGPSSAGVTTFSNAGSTTSFTGMNNFAILNRVAPTVTGDAIFMGGNINSTVNAQVGGTVYFYSPNGIVIGGGATINVGSLGLTTLPIADVQGVWMTGFGSDAPQVAFGAANAGSTIRTSAGSVLSANGPGNYVALVAPRVEHRGTIRTDSGAALVAAGAATVTFRPSGLYDIAVTTGSTDPNGVIVDGGRIERNGAAAGGQHRAYLVSVPANNAMTMLVQGGAQLGFEIAGAAQEVGNAVVLSSGHNVANGAAGGVAAGATGSDGDIAVFGATFGSRVLATARDYFRVGATGGTTRFGDDLTVRARTGQIDASGATTTLLVGGDLSVDVSRVARAAGEAAASAGFNILTLNGATMTVAGTTAINALARGGDSSSAGIASGSATGGTVYVQAQSGSTLNFTNGLTIGADGLAGLAGAAGVERGLGQGGNVFVDAVTGNSRLTVGGILSLAASGSGGTGTGGNVHLRTFGGANNNISVTGATSLVANGTGGGGNGEGAGSGSGGVTGVGTGTTGLISLDMVTMSASGEGGDHSASGTGGTGRGGSALVSAGGGGTVSIGGVAALLADGRGGSAGLGGTGGAATGGVAQLIANGGTVTALGDVDLFADALGGAGDVRGGAATGGAALLRTFAGGNLSVAGGAFMAAIGAGGSGHVGGSALGGATSILSAGAGSTLVVGGPLIHDAFAFGGSGSGFETGGLGGDAAGGTSSVSASSGARVELDSLFAYSGAIGGDGASGGNANGGQVQFGTSGAGSSLEMSSATFLYGSNIGGVGYAGSGGSATGGRLDLFATGGSITLHDALYATMDGQGGWTESLGTGGVGRGGAINAGASEGGTLTAMNILALQASGFGGGNLQTDVDSGAGFGGSVNFNALGAGSTVDARLTVSLSADGWGGFAGGECTVCGGSGGDGTGGIVSAGTSGGTGNRLLFGGDLYLSANGNGSAGFGGSGGSGFGGESYVNLNDDGQIGVAGSLSLLALGTGGDQGNGQRAGDGTGGDAAITLNGSGATLLGVGLDTLLDTSGLGGTSFGTAGGVAGNGAGGWSRIYGSGGRGSFADAVSIRAAGIGGNSNGGVGGDGVGGQTRVNSEGAALAFAGDLLLEARSIGGAGRTGGNAIALVGTNAPATATTDARILALNGTVSVAGLTELDVSAQGGVGSDGGAGGNASAGYATVHARNSDLGPATITLDQLFIAAGAQGGDGGSGAPDSGTDGGAGGAATGGFIAPTASAGNGHLVIGDTIIDGTATGGDGGDGGGGETEAGGAGGAGGAATGARLFIGTESAESAALTVNQGSARFASILAVLDASGGGGGPGGSGVADGIGGRGGAALGGNGEIAVRGSLLETGSISLTANATGGDGGVGPDGTASGAGGNATAGGLVFNVLNRFGNPAMRGTLNAGDVTMAATALGGAGATDGLGYAGGRNFFNVSNGDVRMASFAMFNAGSDGGDPAAQLDPFIIRNATVAVTGDFTVVNPTTISLWTDGGNLSAARLSLSAGNFIRDFTNPAPAAPGTISADTISLLSGRDIIVDAHLSSTAGLTLMAPGSITVGNLATTEPEEAGDIVVTAGSSVTTGAVTASRGITLSAGGTLTTASLSARDDVRLNAAGGIATGTIASQNGGIFLTGGGVATGNLTAGGDVLADSGGALLIGTIAARSAELSAVGSINVGNVAASRWLEADAGGALNIGNVTAGEGIELGATGALAAGNLSAGVVNNGIREGASYAIGILGGTSVALGNASAREWIGIGTRGALAAGTIASGSDLLLLADGAIATGAISTGAQRRLLIAGADMIALGGPTDAFDRSRLFAALGTATEAATRGAVSVGAVSTGRMDALVGADLTTSAVTAASAAYATAGGTVTIDGVWTAPLSRIASDDLAIGAGGGIAGGRVDLVSRNATQLLVGDGLSGSGYAIDNAEFGRLSTAVVNILGRSDASAAIDTLVGTLALTGRADGRSVTIATVTGASTEPAGTLRVTGAITGTGLGAGDTLDLAAGRVEVDAATGGISLLGTGGQLAGALSLVGQRIHVAEAAFLDRLASDPAYAGRDADLARAPLTQRTDGVVRAADINVELREAAGSDAPASYSVLVQNVGTTQLPAGFTAGTAAIIAPDGTAPGAIALNVNGQLVTATGTSVGVAVRDALMADDDPARFTASSLINGCALSGPCGSAETPKNPQPAISTEIALLTTPPADDAPFGNEEAIEDNEEEGGDDSASSPISPPAPLFNTKPLEQKGDTDEPVSGGGNPALIGSGPVEGEK